MTSGTPESDTRRGGGGGERSQPGSSPVSLEAVRNNRLLVVYQ